MTSTLPTDPQEREEIMREAVLIAEQLYAERQRAKAQDPQDLPASSTTASPSLPTSTPTNSNASNPEQEVPPPPYSEVSSPGTVIGDLVPTPAPGVTFFPERSRHLQAHKECVYSIALTAKYLITASRDATVRVWDLGTQRLVYPALRGHNLSALCVAVYEKMDLLFSGGVDGCLIVWRLSTGTLLLRLEMKFSSLLSLAVTDRYLAASFKDKVAKVWGIEQFESAFPGMEVTELAHLDKHSAAVNVVVVHSGNGIVVTGCGDRSIRVYETRNWMCVRSLTGHTKGVATLTFSLSGTQLISGSSDQSIRIWDLALPPAGPANHPVATLSGHSNLVRSVCAARTPQGRSLIISGSYDESVVVWMQGEKGNWEIRKSVDVRDMMGEVGGVGMEAAAKQGSLEGQTRVFKVLCDGERVFVASQRCVVVAFEVGELGGEGAGN